MHRSRHHSRNRSGITLIEVTLVLAVLLGLISVLFIGVSAYKSGSNRAFCLQNISQMQRAMRAFCNYYEKRPGDIVTDLPGTLAGPGSYLEAPPACPSEGTYTYGAATGNPNEIPPPGTAYLSCTITDHVPVSTTGW